MRTSEAAGKLSNRRGFLQSIHVGSSDYCNHQNRCFIWRCDMQTETIKSLSNLIYIIPIKSSTYPPQKVGFLIPMTTIHRALKFGSALSSAKFSINNINILQTITQNQKNQAFSYQGNSPYITDNNINSLEIEFFITGHTIRKKVSKTRHSLQHQLAQHIHRLR